MAYRERAVSDADQKILDEAKQRFEQCESWEADARANFLFDTKFCNADSENLYQWPEDIARDRGGSNRPVLTINKCMQHCLQIINDQRQNQSMVQVRPVASGANYESAKVFEGIIRHIEYQSNSSAVYTHACESQVIAGIGYWRVLTDFISNDSMDQEIYIKSVADPLSIYMDPDIEIGGDGSDSSFAFVYKDLPKDEFERKYPKDKDITGDQNPLGVGSQWADDDIWISKEHVRVVEYFRKVYKKDTLHLLDNGSTVRESDVENEDENQPGIRDQLDVNSISSRDIDVPTIEWFLLGGSRVLDKKVWPGKTIPIIRVLGTEVCIDKRMDRRGHTRALIDPQRIYNYWSSSAVEFVALQSKSPFIAPIEAINGFETDWAMANILNKPYLPYNGLDETGQPIPKPERAPPPIMGQAYLSGLQIAQSEMQMVSGQYEANMGQKSNEVSGTAVNARQRQGETATYHFIDHFAQAIRATGRLLIDLIPKIYDTERVLRVLGEDGSERAIKIDPNASLAHQKMQEEDATDYDPMAIQSIFNPQVGQYDVIADIGPAYATRRQDTFNAISKILERNEAIFPIVGDLLFKSADFPLADKLAERLYNMVPPQALGQADPQVQQLQMQLQQANMVMQKLQNELEQARNKADNNAAKNQVETYRSETDRMKAIGMIDPAAMMPIIRQMVSEALGTPINPLIAAHALENAQMAQPPAPPPSPQAQPQASNGAING